MSQPASALAAFHLTGDRSALSQQPEPPADLRPALFGAYTDLSRLRFDFPLVLSEKPGGKYWLRSLADIVDDILVQMAEPGTEGEETRRQLLALEQAIRSLLVSGQSGSLSLFWEAARRHLSANEVNPEALNGLFNQARELLGIDGEITACDSDTAARLMRCAWKECEQRRATALATRLNLLIHKLSEILEVDYRRSSQAREPGQLARSVGGADQDAIDFHALSRLLETAGAHTPPIDQQRKQRIQDAIDTLRSQRFVFLQENEGTHAGQLHDFEFESCHAARTAFHDRMPEMAAVVRAIAVAELEIHNHYDEQRHGAFFGNFTARQLGSADLAQFPTYRVSIAKTDDVARAEILEALADGLPFKILAQIDDVVGADALDTGLLNFGTKGQQLARMATGSGHAFVMQAPVSSLYRLSTSVLRGMECDFPALFSIYAGTDYLASAAALESRAFPCLVYDPSAGPELASRFDLSGNPQLENAWAGHCLNYETADHDRREEKICFTLADYIATLPQQAKRFAQSDQSEPGEHMITVDEFLDQAREKGAGQLPYVWLIDRNDQLYRAVVDDKLIEATARCAGAWRRLQELGGINNSYAARALAEVNAALQEARDEYPAADDTEAKTTAPAEQKASPQTTEPATETTAEPGSDEPWIESIRCTSCNECTQLNDRLFAYDADMRAYIADPTAGTYRDLVEAAEACQVEIIHPGKPRKPDEPDLEELIKRAEPFQ